MSGRAPSTKVAFEMKILPWRGSLGPRGLTNGGVGSPGCRSRHSSTFVTPMLSSAHPVTAIDPASTVPSPAGVSTVPMGTDGGAAGDSTFNVTLMGPAVFRAPVSANVIAPVTVPDAGRLASYFTETVSVPAPEPEA